MAVLVVGLAVGTVRLAAGGRYQWEGGEDGSGAVPSGDTREREGWGAPRGGPRGPCPRQHGSRW